MQTETTLEAAKTQVVDALYERIAGVRAEIRQLAETGDIFGCDLRHDWIDSVETSIALVRELR
jgi:hypothetical protein